MPTTYAHYRFGNQCIDILNKEEKDIVIKYRELYDIGVHGPDFTFYNLLNSKIPEYGDKMHHRSGFDVFKELKEAYLSASEKEAALSYLLGFFSHYILDSNCHPYVEAKREFSNITHNKVESVYDSSLIEKDGYDKMKFRRADLIKNSDFNAEVLASLFPFTKKEIKTTLSFQKMVLSIIRVPNKIKKAIVTDIIKVVGLRDDYVDLLFEESVPECCMDSNIRLEKLTEKALESFKELLGVFLDYLNDKGELTDYFSKDFEKGPDYKNIKILPYEEELKYQI